jgi:catechol 2,3-dioxygenase-like lactoylglutathione lyase family enzyme
VALSLPALHHVGVVVEDIVKAAADFERRWGVTAGPVHDLTFPAARLRDVEADLSARYCFIDTGASQLEFIQPVSEPSPYTEFLQADGGEGVHHLAYFVDSVDDYLEQLRDAGEPVDLVLDAVVPGGGRFVYVGGLAHGPVVELIETPR